MGIQHGEQVHYLGVVTTILFFILLISGYDNLGLLNDSISKQSLAMNYLPDLLYIMDLAAIGLQNLVISVKSQHGETENVINPHTFS